MAHAYKINISRAIMQLTHNERRRIEETDTIDYSKSNSNICYDYAGNVTTHSNIDRYKKRLAGISVPKRLQVRTMVEWVVTLPPDLKPADRDKFIKSTINFVAQRYGAKNVIGAYLHLDEPHARPHLHIDFIPAVKEYKKDEEEKKAIMSERDKKVKALKEDGLKNNVGALDLKKAIKALKDEYKKRLKNVKIIATGKDKVCAKDIMTLKELKLFHPQYNLYIDKVLGYHVSLQTGACKNQGGNKTRAQYQIEREKRKYETTVKCFSHFADAANRLAAELAKKELGERAKKDQLLARTRQIINSAANKFYTSGGCCDIFGTGLNSAKAAIAVMVDTAEKRYLQNATEKEKGYYNDGKSIVGVKKYVTHNTSLHR